MKNIHRRDMVAVMSGCELVYMNMGARNSHRDPHPQCQRKKKFISALFNTVVQQFSKKNNIFSNSRLFTLDRNGDQL